MKDTVWFRTLFTLGGAVLGAVAGYFLFLWLIDNKGIYGFAIPGGLTAIGAGINQRCPSKWIALVCGILSFLVGNFALWKRIDFVADPSFGYALSQFFQRDTTAWGLILAASILAVWIPWRRTVKAQSRPA